jgi:uncharacterized membrane protein
VISPETASPSERLPRPGLSFEDTPLTRPEYLSVMVHFYRAEVHRSTVWRQRLDATTNWSVLTSAGMLSFAFAEPHHSHLMLLLTNLVVLAFLFIEARRYRYFEVYRARVRMLEENFLLPIITRELQSPMGNWRREVADDLDRPEYKSHLLHAVGFRLRRNYMLIFTMLFGAWFVKLSIHPQVANQFSEIWTRMAVGPLSSDLVFSVGLAFYLALILLLWLGRTIHGGAPVDEIAGLERSLESWKL